LFDVVIIDEASQCDLPSMTPVLFRASQAVVAGDSRQMQAQRFAFTSGQVSAQAWVQFGLDALDPERWFNPATVDLLQLASIRMDEEAYLNEHYRSVPNIIEFSNHRWYGDKLRVMRDAEDRRTGDPDTPAVSLHRVEGRVKSGTQENELEARALVDHLKKLLSHPAYSQASFGVICLFEQQMQLVNEMVADEVDDELTSKHQLVVLNPDGFQGDERDVILYSLSYDGNGMTRDQLTARQANRAHIQGMLNVAFTRPRDEMHIFHSADVRDFGTADGTGAIKDWLEHCAGVKEKLRPEDRSLEGQMAKADSGFEQQVMTALAGVDGRDVKVRAQYPCCGYFIDIVASENNSRLAIECDGEWVHLDEHGELKIEDIERQEVLERAGWRVLRIPYRSWRENPASQVSRVLAALEAPESSDIVVDSGLPPESSAPASPASIAPKQKVAVNAAELAVIEALQAGASAKEEVFRLARARLGFGRLGSKVRASLDEAATSLATRAVIRIEENELFFSNNEMRASAFEVPAPPAPKAYRGNRYSYRR
jgi:very-short-patch-repair endonuclease